MRQCKARWQKALRIALSVMVGLPVPVAFAQVQGGLVLPHPGPARVIAPAPIQDRDYGRSFSNADLIRRRAAFLDDVIQHQADSLSQDQLLAMHQLMKQMFQVMGIGGRKDFGDFQGSANLSVRVVARLDESDVSFEGMDSNAIFAQCQNFVMSGGIRNNIGSIAVNDTTMRNSWMGFQAEQTCAILALNALPVYGAMAPAADVKLDSVAIKIQLDPMGQMQASTDSLILKAIGNRTISCITIGGQDYRRGWQGFNSAIIPALIRANLDNRMTALIASGKIADAFPFVFTGNSMNEIEAECLEFMKDVVGGEAVTVIDVNGNHRSTGYLGMSNAQVCMTVKTLAQMRGPSSGGMAFNR